MNSGQNNSRDTRAMPTVRQIVIQMVIQRAGDVTGAVIVTGLLVLTALLLEQTPRDLSREQPDAVLPAPRPMEACVMDTDGYLRGRMYGALEHQVSWQGAALLCDGTPRPDGDGVRLFFAAAGSGAASKRLIVVIGIDSRPEQLTGREHVANVTVIDESDSRFYSSRGQDRCWTTVSRLTALEATPNETWRVDGVFYCAGALPSLTDSGSLTLDEFSYSGRLVMTEV